MQFDRIVNILLEGLSDKELYNKYGVETFNTTPRKILQNRYGKDTKGLIDAQRAYTKQTAGTSLANDTQKKYSIPDYSRQQLDKSTPVRIYEFPDEEKETGGMSLHVAKDTEKMPSKSNPYIGKEVHINANPVHNYHKIPDVTRAEFQNKTGVGTQNVGGISDNNPEYTDFNITDVVGHENTHSIQPDDDLRTAPEPQANKIQSFKAYTTSAPEAAAWMSNLKYWYYRGTGKTLPANASKQDINDFIKYWESEKRNHPIEWEVYQPVMDLLKTPEGEHLFRRTVMAPKNSNTRTA